MELRFLLALCIVAAAEAAESISPRIRRSLLFTPAAGMGIYLAVAFPIDLPQYELSMSFNVEANYYLPTNATELAYGPQFTEVRRARDLTRGKVYSLIEDHLEKCKAYHSVYREGFLSKPCLLRTICETSASTVLGHNGLLGELLHIIFTPSSTASEDLSPEYDDAEKAGYGGRENCARTYAECPIDLYDLLSMWNS